MLLQACQSALHVLLLRNHCLNEIVWFSQLKVDDAWVCCASESDILGSPGPHKAAFMFYLALMICETPTETEKKAWRHRLCHQGACKLRREMYVKIAIWTCRKIAHSVTLENSILAQGGWEASWRRCHYAKKLFPGELLLSPKIWWDWRQKLVIWGFSLWHAFSTGMTEFS